MDHRRRRLYGHDPAEGYRASFVLAGLLEQKEIRNRTRTQVGAAELSGCSTQTGECTKRYAHDSLGKKYVSKLTFTYERDLSITADWSDAFRIGNLIRSDLITQYMTFTREEQKKAGVAVQQPPAVLPSHLHAIVPPLRERFQCTSDPYNRVVLARNLALFTVAFETTKRGDELSARSYSASLGSRVSVKSCSTSIEVRP